IWGAVPDLTTNKADLERADTNLGNPPSGNWTTYFQQVTKPGGSVAPVINSQWYQVRYWWLYPAPFGGTTTMCWVPQHSTCGGQHTQ
ncbi:MAG: hypothetical protein ACRD4B_02110, partial [Acidobacteriota bacterium]